MKLRIRYRASVLLPTVMPDAWTNERACTTLVQLALAPDVALEIADHLSADSSEWAQDTEAYIRDAVDALAGEPDATHAGRNFDPQTFDGE
jgi:hypothetical protein